MVSLKDVIEFAKTAWANRDAARRAVRYIRRWWKTSHVLLIGPGGTGKTTLARLLAGETDRLTAAPWEYGESYLIERFRMGKRDHVEMVVTPGQKVRRPSTWASVQAELAAGKYRGVILVSAFGYHTPARVGLKQLKPGMSKEEAWASYLTECRSDEVGVLRQLTESLVASPKKVWLLSVVAKQDLWVADEADAHAFYSSGEYDRIVRDVSARRTPQSFCHEIAFVSLLIANLISPKAELLRKNTAGYDQRAQTESVRRLFEAIGQLLVWEAGS